MVELHREGSAPAACTAGLFLGVMVFPAGQSFINKEERAQSLTFRQLDSFIEGEGPETDVPEGVHGSEGPDGKDVCENKGHEEKDIHENCCPEG